MSRRRRHGIPVSLFPFVAVMAATMGALILLLLVISRQSVKARDAAWKRKQEEIERRSPDLPPLPGLAELPKLPPLPPHSLPPLRDVPLPDLPPVVDPRAALAARKAAIEKEIAELQTKRKRVPKPGEERLAPLAREAALLRNKLAEMLAEREKAKKAAEQAASRKDDLAREREKKREQAQRVENRYAVTPYVGTNGTRRRPIYLECRADHVTLQPEGVRLGPGSLARPHDSRNPLAEMLSAVGDALPADGGKPYPLLLVRPDGIENFYRVREALEFLKYSVGYELIPADMELAFPAADPKLKLIAENAAARAREAMRRPRGLAGDGRGNGEGGAQADGGAGGRGGVLD
ncbi:MAG TPA: hypothetical protein VNC50_14480, partial [Planctomycetia bacterium]|nr:hypothetical protein [Planctomycetia bacterium]